MADDNEGVSFAELESAMTSAIDGPATPRDLEAVYNVPMTVQVVLGRAKMPIKDLLKLGRGAVVDLDRKVGEPVDIYVNNRLIARGEVVIQEDHLGVTMTEIIKSDAQQKQGS